jgi:hypothetical protein
VAFNSRFTSIEEYVQLDQVISGEKFLKQSKESGRFNYLKRDFFYRSGMWRDEKVRSLISNRKLFQSKSLVIGHSDIATRVIDGYIAKKLGVPQLFAVNNQKLKGFSHSVPLGITNNCDDSPIHKMLGDESHFLKANDAPFNYDSFTPSLYLNFTAGNNSGVRSSVIAVANKISHIYKIVISLPDFSPSGRIQYLQNLRTNGLVLCPEGNGVDTHRFWETLYMGGIPVVTKNPMMEFFYNNLPVIQLNDWSELEDRLLIEEQWLETTSRSFDFSIMSSAYWIKKFQAHE